MGNHKRVVNLPEPDPAVVQAALGRIPSGLFLVTAAYEERRAGMLAGWVQQVCIKPAMVSVAIAKGCPIMPLISESRRFGLCQLSEEDHTLHHKFSKPDQIVGDPFLGHELIHGNLHPLPILAGTCGYLECELTCHMDFEGDHDLFVGTIRGAGARNGVKPMIHYHNTSNDT